MADDSLEPLEPMSSAEGTHRGTVLTTAASGRQSWLLVVAVLALVVVAAAGIVVAVNVAQFRHDQDQLVCLDKQLSLHQPGTALPAADVAHCH
jgi:hypothetical protein